MAENITNDVQTTLNGSIDASTTSITVTSGTGFPAPNFRVRLDDEWMLVTSTGAGTNWTVTRGIEGSVASAHANAAAVVHVLTKGGLEQYIIERLAGAIHGLTYANNGTDPTNDIDISAGGAMDATDAYWMAYAGGTKRLDANWVVGGASGGLDTGAVGNNDYFIWLIARSDTGVVDALFSLSSTAPTMPANYDYKRLIGWIKRVGGTIVAFTTSEVEGGGIQMMWTTPTLDINLASTLTTSRRLDAVKVPVGISVRAIVRALFLDAASGFSALICDPAETDAAVSITAAPLANFSSTANAARPGNIEVGTDTSGRIAARANIATVDDYKLVTLGFIWSRRD